MTYPSHFAAAIASTDWDWVVRSPGRINIIGEHLDYNGGLVMPAAIDKAIYFAVRKRSDRQLVLHALDLGQQASLPIDQDEPVDASWVNYLLGVVQQFRKLGYSFGGLEVVMGGDLPIGGGVSSSAAMEGGMAFSCNQLLGSPLSRSELAQLCQRSSNQFMGIPSGIMDQFASLNGEKDKVLLLDCSSLAVAKLSAHLPGYTFFLVNSMVSHDLASSAYPQRVAECKAGLAALLDLLNGGSPPLSREAAAIGALNSTVKEPSIWASYPLIATRVSETVLKRCRYVAQEIERVEIAIAALQSGDAVRLGAAMNATHQGLRDDYEVSCEEIDFLQQFAQSFPGVAGSRIMGGGFGGCTLNLIQTKQLPAFQQAIQGAYEKMYGVLPTTFSVELSDGTSLLERQPSTSQF